MADRPHTSFTDPAQIPAYLQKHGRFCLWKYEQNKGRWTKVPYQPNAPQYGAASTNAAHFTSLQAAMGARKGFDGVGLGIFGDIAAIDIDHCMNAAGELSQLAQNVIATMNSYTEISPSGKGIRIIFRAAGVKYDKNAYYINNQDAREPLQEWPEKQGLEVYIAGITNKYVTITGNAINAVEVEERSAEVKQILDRYMKKPTQRTAPAPAPSVAISLSDRELIDIATHARNGADFSRLYFEGDISRHNSPSEADLALFNYLAFYTAGDAARMIQLFKASALYRPEKSGGDKYLERTAQKAIRDCTTYYSAPAQKVEAASYTASASQEEPKKAPATTTATVDAFLMRAKSEDFKPIPTGYRSIDSAIGGGFIRQTIALLGASPGAGKTIFAQQICENMAKEDKANIVFYNLEMSVEQLLARSLSRITEMTPLQILQGYKWVQAQEDDIRRAAEQYKKDIAPRIKYNPCASADYEQILESMEREANALEAAGDTLPLVVVVDYLQLLQGKEKDAAEVIKAAVKGFKDFAIKHNAVVFLIMAHSRATNESGVATQGAGRDTSAIEYSADIQLALTYKAMLNKKSVQSKQGNKEVPEFESLSSLFARVGELRAAGYTKEAEDLIGWRRITITKNRFGVESAFCDLRFEGEHSKFFEKAPKSMEKSSPWDSFKADHSGIKVR